MSDIDRIAQLLKNEIANRRTVTIGTPVATILAAQVGLFITPEGRSISATATNFCYGSCLLAKVEGTWYAVNPQDTSQVVSSRIDRFIQRKPVVSSELPTVRVKVTNRRNIDPRRPIPPLIPIPENAPNIPLVFNFFIDDAIESDLLISYQKLGSAINGLDYGISYQPNAFIWVDPVSGNEKPGGSAKWKLVENDGITYQNGPIAPYRDRGNYSQTAVYSLNDYVKSPDIASLSFQVGKITIPAGLDNVDLMFRTGEDLAFSNQAAFDDYVRLNSQIFGLTDATREPLFEDIIVNVGSGDNYIVGRPFSAIGQIRDTSGLPIDSFSQFYRTPGNYY
jgi:hypothetical protein